jgi:DNA polymerase III subunit delta
MAAKVSSSATSSLVLIWGDEDFGVKQRARQIFDGWAREIGGLDQEIIDASASNSSEALTALGRLRESLQTLPFFGTAKAVWFQNCNFLSDDRTASAQAVTERLGEMARELKSFDWSQTRLLISAGQVDKRKVFFKTVDKLGAVEGFTGWSLEDKDWSNQAERAAQGQIRSARKSISAEALSKLVVNVGPNARLLHNEVEKIVLYAGDREQIEVKDVELIVSRNKQSRAFALGEAFGARDLPRLLRVLDEELWEMKTSSQKSEIGLLYGLITKVRSMIFLKEMLRLGWVQADLDYGRFKMQLEKIPAESFPADKRFNPLQMHPYVLYRGMGEVKNYALDELIQAMSQLLECNQRLIFSRLDGGMVLQQTLIRIAERKSAGKS